VRADQAQHLLVPGRQCLEAVADADTCRAVGDERPGNLPQRPALVSHAGGLQRLAGTVLRRRPPVQAGTQPGQHLHDVPHQVVLDLAVVQHGQAAPGRGQGGLNQLDVHPPRRSLCSTTTVVTAGSASSRLALERAPFMPEAISDSTRTTR